MNEQSQQEMDFDTPTTSVEEGSKALGGFPPTEEQQLIRDHYLKGDNIMVDAGAGSSKTSTSIFLAEQDNRKVLYLAFNRAIKEDAKKRFAYNVSVYTFHGLAYSTVGVKYKHKLFRPVKYVNVAMTVSEIKKFFNIKGMQGCNALRIASLVKDTITRFEHSDSDKIELYHIPASKIEEYHRINSSEYDIDEKVLKAVTMKYTNLLWEKRIDVKSPVLCSHDTYLKLYQLSKPVLKWDCIIGDEFQDVNPVVADIILSQECQKVLIGDPNQSIYGWRGAKNFLKENENYITLYLSKSFRYGQPIAELAKAVIDYKRDLNGFELKDTIIGKVDTSEKYTKIFRTNSCLLMEAIDLIDNGNVKVSFDINHNDFVKKIKDVLQLKNGDAWRVKHPDIVVFETYEELVEEADHEPDLARIVNLIKNNRTDHVIDTLEYYRKPMKPDVLFTTGHKAKGLEWDNVILAPDFPLPQDAKGMYSELAQGEVNLLYVCLTRAQGVLEVNKSIQLIMKERKLHNDNDFCNNFKVELGPTKMLPNVNTVDSEIEFEW